VAALGASDGILVGGRGQARPPDVRVGARELSFLSRVGAGALAVWFSVGACASDIVAPEEDACTNPTELSDGIVSCEEGFLQRVASPTCNATGFVEPERCTPLPGKAYESATSAECDEPERCVTMSGECVCAPYCEADADCPADYRCQCDGIDGDGTCTPSACRTGANCAAGNMCVSTGVCGAYDPYRCQLAEDECRSAMDCGELLQCFLGPDGYRICDSRACEE
jgi:hypothetical protein